MPPSLSLPSSAPPSLYFTPFWFCPHHYVSPPAPPLTTHSNSAHSASPYYSYCWKHYCQILTVKDSFTRLDSFYPSPLFSHSCLQNNWNYLGRCFRFLKTSNLQGCSGIFVMHKHHRRDSGIISCVSFLNAYCQFMLCFGKHKSLYSLGGPAYLTMLL